MLNFFQMLFLYVAGHSLADTALQKHDMGGGKNRHNPIDMSKVPVGQKPLNLAFMWLLHHILIQGLIVTFISYFITRNIILSTSLGMVEFVLHGLIDFGKCESWYNPYVDQSLHIISKIFYITIIIGGRN